MSKATVNSRMPQFKTSAAVVLNQALSEASRDIIINAKNNAPFKTGQLRADSSVSQRKPLSWRVSFDKEYARYQEFGGDSRRTVRKYSTGGTGAHFLKKAGDKQAKKLRPIFKKHGARARA